MVEEPFNDTIDSIVRTLKKSRSILFITGAGISADSGIPTYRGIGGLYDVDLTEDGFPIETVLSGEMFSNRPELTWKYLAQIGDAVKGATFNRGHEIIAEMEKHFLRVWTLTQNIDGFHLAAGSEKVIEIHGNMRSLSCTKCNYRVAVENYDALELPPHCPDCQSVLRPDVVLFGEMLPDEGLNNLQTQMEMGFDLTFSIGTSSVFPYIQAPIEIARSKGYPTVEINPSETTISRSVDYHLPMGAADALDEIWKRFKEAE